MISSVNNVSVVQTTSVVIVSSLATRTEHPFGCSRLFWTVDVQLRAEILVVNPLNRFEVVLYSVVLLRMLMIKDGR